MIVVPLSRFQTSNLIGRRPEIATTPIRNQGLDREDLLIGWAGNVEGELADPVEFSNEVSAVDEPGIGQLVDRRHNIRQRAASSIPVPRFALLRRLRALNALCRASFFL
jgi:hypothetical protein